MHSRRSLFTALGLALGLSSVAAAEAATAAKPRHRKPVHHPLHTRHAKAGKAKKPVRKIVKHG